MRSFSVAILFVLLVSMGGCKSVGVTSPLTIARAYDPHDPMSAENLAQTHPEVQAACEAVGSCSYLAVECNKIDGKTFYYISVPGAHGDDDAAYASGGGDTLQKAATAFTKSLRTQRAKKAYEKDHPQKQSTVTPCDANCGNEGHDSTH